MWSISSSGNFSHSIKKRYSSENSDLKVYVVFVDVVVVAVVVVAVAIQVVVIAAAAAAAAAAVVVVVVAALVICSLRKTRKVYKSVNNKTRTTAAICINNYSPKNTQRALFPVPLFNFKILTKRRYFYFCSVHRTELQPNCFWINL